MKSTTQNPTTERSTLDLAIAAINKQFGDGSIMQLGHAASIGSTPSPPELPPSTSPSASAAYHAREFRKFSALKVQERRPSA